MKHFAKFAALAAVVGLWSCSDDAPEVNPGAENSDGDFFAKITLQLPTSTGSRADDTTSPDGSTVDPGEGNNPSQSTDGYEFGKDYENNVNSLYVVLATANKNGEAITGYNFVTYANGTPVQTSAGSAGNSNSENTPFNAKQPAFVMQFPTADLQDYATDGNATDKELYIFAFCNPNEAVVNQIKAAKNDPNSDFFNEVGEIDKADDIWIAQKNGFFMTNASIHSHTISMSWAELASNCSSKETAYNLSVKSVNGSNVADPVRVERVSCRFDFMSTTIQGYDPNVYPVYDNTTTEGENYAKVTITDMALFNEAKKFYLLRHMSADGTANNWTICGNEYGYPTTDNYVVGPNYQAYLDYDASCAKDAQPELPEVLAASFFYPLATITTPSTEGTTPQNADWTSISSLKEDDTHGSSQKPTWSFDGTDYKIWRYATENPIPSVEAQRQGITTGVVFKANITGTVENPSDPYATDATEDAKSLQNKISWAIKQGEPIYAYRDTVRLSGKANLTMLFGTATDMYYYVASHKGSPQYDSFIAAWKAGLFTVSDDNGVITDENNLFPTATVDGSGQVIPAAGITVELGDNATDNKILKEHSLICYTKGAEGYTCYYYYFNRHNNNFDNSTMGAMEFATVRNNIYKLKVDNVLTLGLPDDITPDPWTPDETPEVYFKVSVVVLDWVVRKNNIIF